MSKNPVLIMIIFGVLLLIIGRSFRGADRDKKAPAANAKNLSFSDVTALVREHPEQIKRLIFLNGKSAVVVERVGATPATVEIPDDGGKEVLIKSATDNKVAVEAREAQGSSSWLSLIFAFLPFLGLLFLLFVFYSMSKAQQNMTRQVTSSKAEHVQAGTGKRTFTDVAGCDEAKQELEEVVEYLREPGLLAHLGGRPPRGVLLVGPPGTGKTLLAKAVAGEADAAFFSISGSQFVEMFVGVGAARVRDLFREARKHAPSILFIDEIDAVGRQRGSGIGGGHDEREQTLNQVLVEMDGFSDHEGVIVMAATNRPDVLDPAMLRPGRFDRQVLVDHPDVGGRQAIFGIHMRGKRVGADTDTAELARLTPGFTGAEIEGACNEAATIAARRIKQALSEYLSKNGRFSEAGLNAITEVLLAEAAAEADAPGKESRRKMRSTQSMLLGLSPQELKDNNAVIGEASRDLNLRSLVITRHDFVEGIDRIQMGVARTSRAKVMSLQEKENTSIHELGHALIMSLIEGGDPVTKITIMPRGRALGVTVSLPASDRYGYTKQQLIARILMSMGGRAAQEVMLGTVDTGAKNDFEQASNLARRMVAEFGMSKLGPIYVSEDSSNPFLGRAMAIPQGCGPELSNAIDSEVRCLVNTCLARAKDLISRHKDFLREANKVLLAKETLLADEWQELLKEHGIEQHSLPPEVDCRQAGNCHHCGHKAAGPSEVSPAGTDSTGGGGEQGVEEPANRQAEPNKVQKPATAEGEKPLLGAGPTGAFGC